MHSRSRRRPGFAQATAALAVSLALAASACSSSDDGGDSSAPLAGIPEVGSLSASSDGSWGLGRALFVRSTDAGTHVVATTAGVYVIDGEPAPPRQVVAFDGPTRTTALAVVDDATALVATDQPIVARIDLATGDELARLEMPIEQRILELVPRPDGSVVVETTMGPLLWSAPDASSEFVLADAPTGRGTATADGRFVAPVLGTAELAVVAEPAGERVPLALPDGATVLDAQASPSSGLIAVTAGIGSNPIDRLDLVEVLDGSTLAPVARVETGRALTSSNWTVTDAAVVAGDGNAITAWNLDGSPIEVAASGVEAMVVRVLAVGDGVLSVHDDGTLVHWPAESWSPTVLDPGGVTLQDVLATNDGSTVVAVDFFGRLTTWDLATGVATVDDRFGDGRATGVAVSGSGDRVAASFDSGTVVVLDASLSEQERFSAVSRSVAVDAVSFDPATDTLVTGIAERTGTLAFDDTVNVWNDALDAPKYTLGGESEDVAGCSAFNARIDFDPNGSAMATASHDFSVAIVDLATGVVDHELPTESGTVLDLAYTPDGRYLVATTEGSMTRVWNTQDFSVAADVATPMGGYHAVAMMPDGVTMAAVELTGSVSLVDILSGEIRSSFAEPAERTASLAVSDDGALVAAPGLDATVSIWSTQSGQRVADLDGATGTVVDLRFVGASKIVAASDDGTVRTWTVDATA